MHLSEACPCGCCPCCDVMVAAFTMHAGIRCTTTPTYLHLCYNPIRLPLPGAKMFREVCSMIHYALLADLSGQITPVWTLPAKYCGSCARSNLKLELFGHKRVRPWPGLEGFLNHASLVSNASRGRPGLDIRSRPTGLLSMDSRPLAGITSICLPRPWPNP